MRNIFLITVLVLIGAISFDIMASEDFHDVEIKSTKITDKIYMIKGMGGNIGVSVGEDGILIIDDQFAGLSTRIEETLSSISKSKLRYVLNTHWHGDHTGGNEHFGKIATIIAHENVRQRLSTEQFNDFRNKVVPPHPKDALPVITYNDRMSVYFNGEQIELIHLLPAHTDGDTVVFFRGSKVVHIGDLYFPGFPFVDLKSGGSVDGLIKNINTLIKMIPADYKIMSGHSELVNKDKLREYLEMLLSTSLYIESKIEGGKEIEAIIAEGLPKKWRKWGEGFISESKWIKTIYSELK